MYLKILSSCARPPGLPYGRRGRIFFLIFILFPTRRRPLKSVNIIIRESYHAALFRRPEGIIYPVEPPSRMYAYSCGTAGSRRYKSSANNNYYYYRGSARVRTEAYWYLKLVRGVNSLRKKKIGLRIYSCTGDSVSDRNGRKSTERGTYTCSPVISFPLNIYNTQIYYVLPY